MQADQTVKPRRLTQTYLAALTLIGLMVLGGNLVTMAYLDRQADDARTINLAGRQRMLYLTISQEAWLAAQGEEVVQRRQACQRLRLALAEWDRVHQGLVRGDAELGLTALASPQARELLGRLEHSRRAILTAAQDLIANNGDCRDGGRRLPEIMAHGESYLPLMDRLVFIFDQESRARVVNLRRAEMALDGLTVLGLALVGLFIFRPMVRRIQDDLALLEGQAASFQDLSLTDELTGLANRRAMDQHLEREWRRAAREGHSLSLVMLDVDRFKQYNDAHGHLQGDRALQAVAGVVAAAARRPGDLAARFGGEELALVLPGANLAAARGLAEQVRRQVRRLGLPHPASGVQPVLTASLGVASLNPGPVVDVKRLLGAADRALYLAKQGGRDRVEAAA
ncbi:MAG: diguanylate cyclase domain-containing protein [Thermodesulfobacteriota bacterium]